MPPSSRRVAALLLPLLALLSFAPTTLGAQKKGSAAPAGPDSTSWASLRYRYIGPEGNRASAVVGVPGDRSTYYAGAASGGVWKTTDGGIHWTPVFDREPAQSIGALAVASSNHNVVWAGTGEPFIRSHISLGDGIYKSTDAGATWKRMGLEESGRIARIAVDPTDEDVVFAAVEGTGYGPQSVRGVWRTTDGGTTWKKVLFVNDSTGADDVVIDPTNPRIVYAGTWQFVIHTWGRFSGGAGSGIWKSTDGGDTWKRLGAGLPTYPFGKTSVAVSASDPQRVWALVEAGDGTPDVTPEGTLQTKPGKLWRSDNGGASFTMVNADRELSGRGAYYTRMIASPDNENEAYFLTASFTKTLDGGLHTVDLPFPEQPGGDHHDMWIDPTDGNRMIVSSDVGVSISENRGKSWNRIQLAIAQVYHVETDNAVPYRVYVNRQDGPSYMGPSNNRSGGGFGFGGIPRGDWSTVGGGESGWATPDTVNDDLVWSSASGSGGVGGIVTRYDRKSKLVQNVEVWPMSTIGWPARDVRYRFVWDFPLTISPHDHNTVYVGSQHVHVTHDGGMSWQVMSPDLTRDDTTRMGPSGGLTPDNIGVEYSGTIYRISESPVTAGLIWVGTNDGRVQLTRDDGKTWTNVTRNLPGLPDWGTISSITPSRWDAGTAYLTVDGHQADDFDPWIYKTTDYGAHWRLMVDGIPKSPLSYTHVVTEDPVRRGLLYAGTENGLYVSFDDAAHWQPLQTNLPHAPVYWIVVQPHFHDLVVATYGRGVWILDDITPLERLTDAVAESDAHLFAPREAWRFRSAEGIAAPFEDPSAGQNPQYGASLDFWLKTASKDTLSLEIGNAAGQVVRTLKTRGHAGINRVWWNLQGEQTPMVKMRTEPIGAPYIELNKDGWRESPDIGQGALLQPPGTYTVTLKGAGGDQAKQLVVRKDPHSGGTAADIALQAPLLASLKADLESVVAMVNGYELMRGQLVTLKNTLAGDTTLGGGAAGNADLRAAVDSLNGALMDAEGALTQLKESGRGQDVIRWPMMLGARIEYLAQEIESSDFAPTQQEKEVADILHDRARTAKQRYAGVLAGAVASFNARLRQRNVGALVTPGG